MILFAFLMRLDAVNTNAMELSLVPCRLKRIPWSSPSQQGCRSKIVTIIKREWWRRRYVVVNINNQHKKIIIIAIVD